MVVFSMVGGIVSLISSTLESTFDVWIDKIDST